MGCNNFTVVRTRIGDDQKIASKRCTFKQSTNCFLFVATDHFGEITANVKSLSTTPFQQKCRRMLMRYLSVIHLPRQWRNTGIWSNSILTLTKHYESRWKADVNNEEIYDFFLPKWFIVLADGWPQERPHQLIGRVDFIYHKPLDDRFAKMLPWAQHTLVPHRYVSMTHSAAQVNKLLGDTRPTTRGELRIFQFKKTNNFKKIYIIR